MYEEVCLCGAAKTFVELLPRSWSSRDPELWRACQACQETQAVAVGGGCLALGDLQDIANFADFRVLTLLTDDSGAADTFVELCPRSRSSRDPELWRAYHACHEAQAVAVGGGCLAQGDLPDMANFANFRILTLLTDDSGKANTFVELLPRSRSSRDPDL